MVMPMCPIVTHSPWIKVGYVLHNIAQLFGYVLWDDVLHERICPLIPTFLVYKEHVGCVL